MEQIKLTESAVKKLAEIIPADDPHNGLRVAVKGGGCSGFQYALGIDECKQTDNRFEQDGIVVVVDPVSFQFVEGATIDFVDGLQGAGFQVNNPNVKAACGCGQSFTTT